MSATNAAPPGRVAAPSRASRFAPSAFLGKPPSYGGNDGANAAASGSGKSSRIDQRAARLSSASLGRKAFAGSVGASLWVRPVGSCSRASCRTYADRELRERERERERESDRKKKEEQEQIPTISRRLSFSPSLFCSSSQLQKKKTLPLLPTLTSSPAPAPPTPSPSRPPSAPLSAPSSGPPREGRRSA